ncbi:DEAD/DEAH box helicase [Marinilabiliaceae bacterium JC017]|nr:DEAD/DEAH box helicase [Marinilabiliaceae bacterium JC017]
MKFEDFGIDPEIVKSIQKLGFKRPTDIQYKSIPPILKGEDVLAIAQTGTGKTAAFAIPVLHVLGRKKIAKRADGVKCIVMVPTHELASQITEVFEQIGKHSGLKSYCIFGGVKQDPQIARLEKGVDILVATPGRMFDLVSQGHLRLNRVEILILDEADHMLDLGFLKDIQDMMRFLPKKRQTLFFSATIDKKIKKLAYSLVTKPIRIQISPKNPVARNVTHSVAFIQMDDKRFFLERVVQENPDSKILVFVRTKVRAERVCKAMERVGIKSMTIHSDKNQQERFDALNQFRKKEVKMLIATDVSARGIDIPNVDYVVNYDLPERSENYVHRVGRTGRGTQKGFAVSFCSDEEKEVLSEIEEFLGKEIEVMTIDKSEYADTLDLTQEKIGDWKSLLLEDEKEQKQVKRKKKKKK